MNNDLISRSELCLDLVEKVWPGCDICRGDTKIKSDNFCGAAIMQIVGDSIDLCGDAKKIKFFGKILPVLREAINRRGRGNGNGKIGGIV